MIDAGNTGPDPARGRRRRYAVANADEIAPGERKIVTVAGRSIGIFNVGGEFFALRNRCPHQGGALCTGQLWGVLRSDAPGEFQYDPSQEILACPWHGWEFDIRTGQSWCTPERLKVRSYKVSRVGAEEAAAAAAPAAAAADSDAPAPGMVKGPHVAETYPVERSGAYLVVEMPSG